MGWVVKTFCSGATWLTGCFRRTHRAQSLTCSLISDAIPGQKHRGRNNAIVWSWPRCPALSWSCSRIHWRAVDGITNCCCISGESPSPTHLTRYSRLFLILRRDFSLTRVLHSWLRPGPEGHGVPLTTQLMIWDKTGSSACSFCQSTDWSNREESYWSGSTASSKATDSTRDSSEVAYWHIACTTACGTTSFNFCGHLMRERTSASRLEEPVLYTMSKLYWDSAATQRCPMASSFAVVRTYVRGLLSV